MDGQINLSRRSLWGFGSALLLAIGSLGPWVKLGPFSASGTSGDGVITLVLALAAFVLLVVRKAPILVALLAAVSLATGLYDTSQISSSGNDVFSASIGWGLVLVDLAAVSLIAFGVIAFRDSRGVARATV